MGSLLISFIFTFTFNTLLFLAASHPGWSSPWPPFYQWAPSPPYNKPPPGSYPWAPPAGSVSAKTFAQCMRTVTVSSDFYTPDDIATFTSILNSTAQNFRCLNSKIRKPILIFRPTDEKEVPPAVNCARRLGLNMRIRSGGHDYEGLSYISLMKKQPFMILDLYNLRGVNIDTKSKTAWVQAGATNGELYYEISQKSRNLAFPAGLCTSLGIGGHLTGGAYGSMMRRFGLGADNVLDVRMVDAWGIVRSKQYKNMDKDLFWALTGAGGGSFGVILAWKIKLVNVPSNVTMFTAVKTLEQEATLILNRWQYVAPKIDSKLFIRVIIQANVTVTTVYQALYLGDAKTLASIMQRKFPQLGVKLTDCREMSWIESVMVIAGFNNITIFPPEYLLQHQPAFQSGFFKAKSDFLRNPMSKKAINGMWKFFMEKQGQQSLMIWNPYGGKMADIPESATPFPHREGVICKIQYVATWFIDNPETQLSMEDWMRRLYEYMGKYMSNPREAYVNYRDLDIGKKEGTGSNCSYPSIWGPKYYKEDNFEKLVKVKSNVDPFNFFNHEQSIPTQWMLDRNQCTEVD